MIISFNNHVTNLKEKLKNEMRCVENGGEGRPIYKETHYTMTPGRVSRHFGQQCMCQSH